MIVYLKKMFLLCIITSIALIVEIINGVVQTSATGFRQNTKQEHKKLEKECVYWIQGVTNDPFIRCQWYLMNDGKSKYKELLLDGSVGKEIVAKQGIDIQWEKAQKYFKQKGKNRKIIVALIDTGVDVNQLDLKKHIWLNDLEEMNGLDDDQNGYIDDKYGWNFLDNTNKLCEYTKYNSMYKMYEDDHGTHCAGIIAATSNNKIGIAGIAGDTNVKIMVLKALGCVEGAESGCGITSSIIEAIHYAESMGAEICNISFGGYEEDIALKRAMANSDMLFVCAAGNEAVDIDLNPIYPAGYDLDNVISVCNLNADGTIAKTSNYGKKKVDLAAPGSDIVSTLVNNEFGKMTGTSMAAPMVTGAAAMLYSFHANMTAADAKQIILGSVKKLPTLKNKVKTGGILNMEAMLKKKYKASPVLDEIVIYDKRNE